jgi:uncharacterized protein with PIN domain
MLVKQIIELDSQTKRYARCSYCGESFLHSDDVILIQDSVEEKTYLIHKDCESFIK